MKNILLFPGGFKPFHDGHLSILDSHISNIDNVHIDEVYIYISNKDRDNITANSTLWFLKKINEKLNNFYNINIIPIITDIPSPIGKCYNIVNQSDNDDKFCLVTSNKDDDLKRKQDFVNYYEKKDIDKVIYINADIKPVYYKLRYDEYNNMPISSRIIRDDIYNNNFYSFSTAYNIMLSKNIINKYILREYFDILLNLI
jgi:hypothetical protein